jgi:hypothetical protein
MTRARHAELDSASMNTVGVHSGSPCSWTLIFIRVTN